MTTFEIVSGCLAGLTTAATGFCVWFLNKTLREQELLSDDLEDVEKELIKARHVNQTIVQAGFREPDHFRVDKHEDGTCAIVAIIAGRPFTIKNCEGEAQAYELRDLLAAKRPYRPKRKRGTGALCPCYAKGKDTIGTGKIVGWRGEITVDGKRRYFTSKSKAEVERWLEEQSTPANAS